MNITINEQEGCLVAALSGDLDNVASTQAERDLAPVFGRDDCDVILDCTDLNYISSSTGAKMAIRLLIIFLMRIT